MPLLPIMKLAASARLSSIARHRSPDRQHKRQLYHDPNALCIDCSMVDVSKCAADKSMLLCRLPQIRQVSAQVHDIRGRVKKLAQLLQAKGFEVQVYQEPRFAACNLHMLYASRPGKT